MPALRTFRRLPRGLIAASAGLVASGGAIRDIGVPSAVGYANAAARDYRLLLRRQHGLRPLGHGRPGERQHVLPGDRVALPTTSPLNGELR